MRGMRPALWLAGLVVFAGAAGASAAPFAVTVGPHQAPLPRAVPARVQNQPAAIGATALASDHEHLADGSIPPAIARSL